MKKVLVTGADGFIGSHLVEELLRQGYKVKAFCFYNSFNTWGWIDSLPKEIIDQIEIFTGDVRDPNGVRTAMKGCDVVYHLAALIAIPYSYHSPDSYVDTNVKGTLNIIQAARDLNIKRLLVTSTSEIYGTAQYVPIDELHPKQPLSPYSAPKIGADCMADSFYRSFDMPISIVRPFNTYGPRQSARAIIPTLITQILSNKKIIKVGNIKPRRDLTFVEDTTEALLLALKSKKNLNGEIFNIGSEYEISIEEILDLLNKDFNFDFEIKIDKKRIRPIKSEVNRLLSSSKKFKKITGWKPIYSDKKKFKIALSKTIEWFKKEDNLKLYKSSEYNL